MKAITLVNGSIVVAERDRPEPQATEVLIQVRSAGLNGADLLQKAGHYPPPPNFPPDLPGLEYAGRVVEVGSRVRQRRINDLVMGIGAAAGQCEFIAVDESWVVDVPSNLPLNIAGGFPEAFYTAFDALFSQGHLTVGERVCIHGASGGVGLAAAQLAVAAGAIVTTTSRHPQHHEYLERLGTNPVLPEEFPGRGPFDLILELVGAPNLSANLDELNEFGRICIIGVGAGAVGEIDLRKIMGKRATIMGSTLRSRSSSEKASVAAKVQRHVVPLVEKGLASVPVDSIFDFNDAAAAYDAFASGGKLGKIIINFPET